MINFDFSSAVDNNGFIRFSELPLFNKFIDIFNRKSITVSCDPNKALYKDYNITVYSTHGKRDFAELCEAEVFINRISKYFPKGWTIISTINSIGKRVNRIVNIWKYGYCNIERANPRTIVVHYFSVDNYGKININIDDLSNLCYRSLTDEEVSVIEHYSRLVNKSKPAPIYKVMEIKPIYKENYDLYIEDCNKYGFSPLNKYLIEHISLENPIYINSDGCISGASDDTLIVNKD